MLMVLNMWVKRNYRYALWGISNDMTLQFKVRRDRPQLSLVETMIQPVPATFTSLTSCCWSPAQVWDQKVILCCSLNLENNQDVKCLTISSVYHSDSSKTELVQKILLCVKSLLRAQTTFTLNIVGCFTANTGICWKFMNMQTLI